ncbi:hypothetical protein Q5427_11055 [Brochothrix thermosphacta]|uniref:hypothetical protein n=1 Tax=Brochothrix thermosphacta TaxID=2756 RepID=UPI0027124372|nr:hypothetical protein [Brochothrix thermosphacta]MDO7864827.1 hypothetical protein [Brochothrix thermosphacta]
MSKQNSKTLITIYLDNNTTVSQNNTADLKKMSGAISYFFKNKKEKIITLKDENSNIFVPRENVRLIKVESLETDGDEEVGHE